MEYKPHPYQQFCEQRIIAEPSIALYLEMGLGKSVITLSAIRRLKYEFFQVHRVLVIAPLKVAEATWTNEAAKWDHLKGLRLSRVLGIEKERLAALRQNADIYVINRDNVAWLVRLLREGWPFDMVVIDELTSFKNHAAKRFRALKAVLPSIRRVVGLTGTPAPGGIADLWSQIYLLDRGKRLGRSITSYRAQYFTHTPYTHEYKPLPGSEERVRESIRDISISLSAADYLQMPDLITDDIPVMLDAKATAAYRAMERDMVLSLGEETITAASAAVLTNKLLQLCSGAAYTEESGTASMHDCKLDALIELVDGRRACAAVLAKHEVPRLVDGLQKLRPGIQVRTTRARTEDWNAGSDVCWHPPAARMG